MCSKYMVIVLFPLKLEFETITCFLTLTEIAKTHDATHMPMLRSKIAMTYLDSRL